MPVIQVHLIDGYTAEDKTRLCAALTDAARMIIPAPPEAVTVMVQDHDPAGYMRGRSAKSPAAALPDAGQVVRAYLAAMEARDLDRARLCLGPGFSMTFPASALMTTLEELIAWSKPRYRFVKKQIDRVEPVPGAGAATVVYCTGTLYGEWPDGTSFEGIRFVDRFELTGGLITRQEVWNDIAETLAQAEAKAKAPG